VLIGWADLPKLREGRSAMAFIYSGTGDHDMIGVISLPSFMSSCRSRAYLQYRSNPPEPRR
jgi:hypothetical protein